MTNGRRKSDRFTALRQTMRKRLQAKLAEVKFELRRRLHDSVPEIGKWLRSVWIPPARICHPYPLRRLGVIT